MKGKHAASMKGNTQTSAGLHISTTIGGGGRITHFDYHGERWGGEEDIGLVYMCLSNDREK